MEGVRCDSELIYITSNLHHSHSAFHSHMKIICQNTVCEWRGQAVRSINSLYIQFVESEGLGVLGSQFRIEILAKHFNISSMKINKCELWPLVLPHCALHVRRWVVHCSTTRTRSWLSDAFTGDKTMQYQSSLRWTPILIIWWQAGRVILIICWLAPRFTRQAALLYTPCASW